MPRVRHAVRPHPDTVTALSSGSLPRRRRAVKSGKNGPITSLTLHPLVLEWLKETFPEGKIDTSRLEILSYDKVIVHNPGWRKQSS